MATLVRHVPGSGDDKAREICGCPSWISHWERHSGSVRTQCMRIGCTDAIQHGAHVKWVLGVREYIIALCASCNHPSVRGHFEVDERTRWVRPVYLVGCGVFDELDAGDVVRLNPSSTDTFELIRRRRRLSQDSAEWMAIDEDGDKTKIVLKGKFVRRARSQR